MLIKPMFDVYENSSSLDRVAVELEYILDSPINNLLQVALALQQYKYITTEVVDHKTRYVWHQSGERLVDVTAINHCVIYHLNLMYPNLMHKAIAPDNNVSPFTSLELAVKPYDLPTFHKNKEALSHVLSVLEAYGYSANHNCGMHIWFDYSFFGNDLPEVSNTIENFYIFLAMNDKFMSKITNRPTLSSSFLASIWAQLGDPFKLDPKASLAAFKSEKQKFIKSFMMDKEKQLFNIVWGKNGTNAVEFRWCASTLDYDTIFNSIILLKNVITFCRYSNENDLSERQFIEFSKLHIEESSYSKGLKKKMVNSLNSFC